MKCGTSLNDLDFFKVETNPLLSQLNIPWPCAQNRVVVTSFNIEIDHQLFVGMVDGSSYKNCRLSALTQRFYTNGQYIEPTGQAFASGLYVSMGTNSERVTLLFIHILRIMISNLPNLKQKPFISPMFVCNRVSSGVYENIDILNFEKKDGTRIVRHRESFSGIIYRRWIKSINRLVSMSIFESGNYILMNIGNTEAILAFTYFFPILERNRMNKNPSANVSQKIAAIRDAYAKFNPATDCIISCVKNGFFEADKSVLSRNTIINNALKIAQDFLKNNESNNNNNSSSSSHINLNSQEKEKEETTLCEQVECLLLDDDDDDDLEIIFENNNNNEKELMYDSQNSESEKSYSSNDEESFIEILYLSDSEEMVSFDSEIEETSTLFSAKSSENSNTSLLSSSSSFSSNKKSRLF